MRRRHFLGGGVATVMSSALPQVSAARTDGKAQIPFGAAVRDSALVDDYDYRMSLTRYCDLLVPEGSLKWGVIRPSAEEFNFFDADRIFEFAQANGMQLRGHTLAWYAAMPDWANAIKGKAEASRHFLRHIDTVVGRYKGKIPSWDVVNESIADDPTGNDYLRPNVWLSNLGAGYIETAFRRAAKADPACQLVINEYDIEAVGDRYKRRRESLLKLIKNLRDRDTPIHAVGLQGHLQGELEIDKEGVSSFVAELKAMNLDVLVTELDVIDNELPAEDEARDAAVAARASDFLQAIFDAARPTAILAWGISDKYTWVPMYFTRDDGRLNRPLPLDREYKPKPLMQVIEKFAGVTR